MTRTSAVLLLGSLVAAHVSETLATAQFGESSTVTEASLKHDHGITLSDVRNYGLTSSDLAELGVHDVKTRLSILRAARILQPAPFQEFVFVVSHFNSSRQFGKCLNAIVKYRYVAGMKPNATGGGWLDYRDVRQLVLDKLQPTDDLPADVQWELINVKISDEINERYSSLITHLSVQIQVHTENNTYINEPGHHGSILTRTIGGVTFFAQPFVPLSEPWINAFQYDCTRENGPVIRRG